jgi:hypothetical protein
MNLLPVEALHKILLNLRVNYLITINKHFLSLHNAYYYKCYLGLKYPELTFVGNFKKLCKKSLKEGTVSMLTKEYIVTNTSTMASKALTLPYSSSLIHLLLRFNGYLYLYDGSENVLLDTDVIDIETCTYIKRNEWYFIFHNNSPKNIHNYYRHLIVTSDKKFLAVLSYNRWNVTAHTLNTIYNYTSNSTSKPSLLTSKTFDTPIYKVSECIYSCSIFVLFKNNELIVLDNQLRGTKAYIKNIENIAPCLIKRQGIWSFYQQNIYNGFAHLGTFKTYVCSFYSYILTDMGLFLLSHLKFIKCNSGSKIINIFGNGYGVYQITS